MRDIDPTASEYISSNYLQYSRPGRGARLYDPVTATIATVGAGLLGSKMSSDASSNASDAQVQSSNNASANSLTAALKSNALQKEMFDKQVELQSPFREAGLKGQNRLMDLLGLSGNTGADGYGSATKKFGMSDFQQDPGYQWRLQQGQQALDRSASARGGMFSGRAAKDLMNYGQGAASQEYGNAYNRFQTDRAGQLNPLQSLSGMAQSSSNTIGNAAGNYDSNVGNTLTSTANQVGNNMMGAGNARASGYVGGANALNSGISSGINAYQNYNMMSKLFQPKTNAFGWGNQPAGASFNIDDF